jgi:Tfp pilus assembly protein PilP
MSEKSGGWPFQWRDAAQWRAWAIAPWTPAPVRWRWTVWHAAFVTVLLLWGALRLGPLAWQATPLPVPMETRAEADAAEHNTRMQAIAQGEAAQAAWAAALALAPEHAMPRLQPIAAMFDLKAVPSNAPAVTPAFKREMAWTGSWESLLGGLRQMTQQVPSLWLGRVTLSPQPGAGIEARVQWEASMPSPAWPVSGTSSARLHPDNPFDAQGLARRLWRQSALGPHAPGPQRSPLQETDPQALRLLGTGGHAPQRWAVLGHQAQVFTVQVGDKVGWHRGWVKAVHADRLEIEEHVLGPEDAWQKRLRSVSFTGQSVQP